MGSTFSAQGLHWKPGAAAARAVNSGNGGIAGVPLRGVRANAPESEREFLFKKVREEIAAVEALEGLIELQLSDVNAGVMEGRVSGVGLFSGEFMNELVA